MKMTTTTKKKEQESQSNLTYEDIEPIVEYLVRVKAPTYTFDCWDIEDIAQEIRIICLYHALPKYDASKSKDKKQLINYFGRCVDNRLKNLKRDKYIRFTPPFSRQIVCKLETNTESNPDS